MLMLVWRLCYKIFEWKCVCIACLEAAEKILQKKQHLATVQLSEYFIKQLSERLCICSQLKHFTPAQCTTRPLHNFIPLRLAWPGSFFCCSHAMSFARPSIRQCCHRIHARKTLNSSLHRVLNTAAATPRNTCLMFAGQGSHAAGMGHDMYNERRDIIQPVLNGVSQSTGIDYEQLLFGPDSKKVDVRRTDLAQPAIFAICYSLLQCTLEAMQLRTASQLASVVMGHSLGEFTALTACEAFTVAQCAALLRVRGESMLSACPPPLGAMAVLMPCSVQYARQICDTVRAQHGHSNDSIVRVANVNSHQQVVVSGHREAVESVIVLARSGVGLQSGVRIAKLLDVSSPFHCELMQPAATPFSTRVSEQKLAQLQTDFVANVDAKLYAAGSDCNSLKPLLVQQLTAPVQWHSSVCTALDTGVRNFIEFAPARVLAPLVAGIAQHRKVADVKTITISNLNDIKQLQQQYLR